MTKIKVQIWNPFLRPDLRNYEEKYDKMMNLQLRSISEIQCYLISKIFSICFSLKRYKTEILKISVP